MPTSVSKAAKKLAHILLGPGGYTQIMYKFNLTRKSAGLKLNKFLGKQQKNVTDLAEFDAQLRVLNAGAARFYDKTNFHRDLRRDVHRLEKGITAANRRKIFGIEPCSACITALERKIPTDLSTLSWANAVLLRYSMIWSRG